MQIKKSLAAILSTTMTLAALSVSAGAAEQQRPLMEDAANSWAAEAIDRWVQHGVVHGNGDGTFRPYHSLTRGELATIFVRLFGLTERAENRYDDLSGSEWYADAVLRCTAAGILEGDGKNIHAEAAVTRQEAMTMFARAMGLPADADPDLSRFVDGGETADWAAGYMAPLAQMGIVQGVGANRLAPRADIDRASAMALLDKAIEAYIIAPGEVVLENENSFAVVNLAASAARAAAGAQLSGETAGLVAAAGTDAAVIADDLTVDTVKIDGPADVTLTGSTAAGTVTVNAAAAVTVGAQAQADTVALAGAQAALTVDGSVGTVTVSAAQNELDVRGTVMQIDTTAQASDTAVQAQAGAQIDAVSAAGAGLTVQGEGAVARLTVSEGASDVVVHTTGTRIDNNSSEAVTVGTGTIEPGKTGTAQGADQAPTQDGSSGGSTDDDADDDTSKPDNKPGGSGGSNGSDEDEIPGKPDHGTGGEDNGAGETPGGSTDEEGDDGANGGTEDDGAGSEEDGEEDAGPAEEQPADVVAAPLDDQSDTIEPDSLVQDYRVTGVVKEDVTEVTIHGTHLMKHENAQNAYNYWIGFGIPAQEGNVYYAGFGDVPHELGEPVTSIADRTYESGGKTYNTVYFGLKDKTLEDGAYVVVKNGEDRTTYKVSFDVTLAPVAENLQLWIVHDEASYNRIPTDYTDAHPWDEGYLAPEGEAGLPWLALSYDSNVTGAVDIQVTRDGEPVGTIRHESSTVGANRYQLWHLTQPADHEGKDYLDQEETAGTYVVTITKDGQTVTSGELVYAGASSGPDLEES